MSENGNGHVAEAEPETVKILSVMDILSAADITEEVVYVPEWNGSVRIRAFTKGRQQELRGMATDHRGKLDTEKLELQLFIYGVIEPKFVPIQMTELREKSAGALDRVIKRIMAISGLSEESIAEAEKSDADRP